MILYDERKTRINLQDSKALDILESKLTGENGTKWIYSGNYKFVFTRISKNTFDFGFEIINTNTDNDGYELGNLVIDHFFNVDLEEFFYIFTRVLRFKIDFSVAEIDRIQKAVKKVIGEHAYTLAFPLSWGEN